MTLQSHRANPCLVARPATQHVFDKWQHAERGQLQHLPNAAQNVHSLKTWQHFKMWNRFSVSDTKIYQSQLKQQNKQQQHLIIEATSVLPEVLPHLKNTTKDSAKPSQM